MKPFDLLGPDLVIAAVESVLGVRCDGTIDRCNSYVNRVFGVRADDGQQFIIKFYRPGRWSSAAIEDEHQFLADLQQADVPVVAPIPDSDGDTLFEIEHDNGPSFLCAIFPRRAGRTFDAEREEDWLRLGSLVGRMHMVGLERDAPERIVLNARSWGGAGIRALMEDGVIHPDCREEFREVAEETLAGMAHRFDDFPVHRVHGDCHRGNILNREGEGLLLIDFDDMMTGPAVQDLWLLLPDHRDNAAWELMLLEEGYRQFRPLDVRQFDLIEGLRFLRMIHYLAWQARQRHDAGFHHAFPQWGSRAFWVKEVEDLRDQVRHI